MKDSLAVGIEHELTYQVTDDMAPPHLPAKVLSTPSMIREIEHACLLCAQPHLDEHETTVGTHVNVSHAGPARSGDEVRVRAKLIEINKRRLLFETEVFAPGDKSISTGTHERAVVDLRRMTGS